MTRTAADVKAQIERLESVDEAMMKVALATGIGGNEALGAHLETMKVTDPLKEELARLEREELDASATDDEREQAVALRDAFLGARGMLGEGPYSPTPWDGLTTRDAAAWLAAARAVERR